MSRDWNRRWSESHRDGIDTIASAAEKWRDANAAVANNDGKYSVARDEAELAFMKALHAHYGSDWTEATIADLEADLPSDDEPTPCHKDLWAQRGDPRESGL
jgi:hypothetical protein